MWYDKILCFDMCNKFEKIVELQSEKQYKYR